MADSERRERPTRGPVIIGWREVVALPDWGIEGILAKADTGARSTALDVSHLEELPGDRVRFEVAVDRSHLDVRVPVECDVWRRATVKSSLGDPHQRIFVKTRLKVGPIVKTTQIGLVDRENMLCRMLIGRRTLKPRMLVDSGSTYVVSEPPA